MISAASGFPAEKQRILLTQKEVFLKAECDFRNRVDKARFLFSLDGQFWNPIGGQMHMAYTIPHFMGYRFGLFDFATKTTGGFADFDFFRVSDQITKDENK